MVHHGNDFHHWSKMDQRPMVREHGCVRTLNKGLLLTAITLAFCFLLLLRKFKVVKRMSCGAPQVEAGKRLEELRRRRGETESEEFEKLKQKQQEAALELEELKKKMPEDGLSEDKKPFKCFTPKGSSLKIEERAEFLNKSVQKSGVKSTHQAAVVSKIDSRLEQYTNAIEGTKASKPTKPAASDLPVPAEGVRNIKSMWEKGNVFSSPSASATPNKETAGLKVGVSSRINEWLTKSPDGNKSPAPKPSDLRPGDVSGKRNLWEKQSVEKVTSPTKV